MDFYESSDEWKGILKWIVTRVVRHSRVTEREKMTQWNARKLLQKGRIRIYVLKTRAGKYLLQCLPDLFVIHIFDTELLLFGIDKYLIQKDDDHLAQRFFWSDWGSRY
jgi:hypothetical protein